jgi:hypothetical protein
MLFLGTAFLACSSICASNLEALKPDEVAILQAAIRHELASSDVSSRRPVLLLDRTDKWMPEDDTEENLDNLPPDAQQQILEQIEKKRIPQGLRLQNTQQYSLVGLIPPNPVMLYNDTDFNKEYDDLSAFRKLVDKFGNEPFVLSLSRPYQTPGGKAVLLLHRLSTWSGCGGVDIIHLAKSQNAWKVEDWDLLVFW